MDLVPLKLYRILYQFKETADASQLFKRICNELINERINILRNFGLVSFYGGEAKIKKHLESALSVPSDVERENDLNETIRTVLNDYVNKFKTESFDFRQLIGFLNGKTLIKATFINLEKNLKSLPKTSKVYISKELKNEPCNLLTNSFKELDSYRDIPELVELVDQQLSSGPAYNAVNGTSTSARSSFINQYILPNYHFLTKEQADKVLDEARQDHLLRAQESRNKSRRAGIFAFIGSSLVYFFAFFFLSLLATAWGYSAFGDKTSGTVANLVNYKTALFGMIFILPTFFLATYFGSYERRWGLDYDCPTIFRIAPRFIPSATLIVHAVLLFNLTKHSQGEALNNIFNKVFYLGNNGYTLALIYIFIAVTTLFMDLFSIPRKETMEEWNSKPGALWLTQNSSYYIIPFAFFLRLFMPAISLGIMVALTILTFIFGLAAPVVMFLIQLKINSDDGEDYYCYLDSFVCRRGILSGAVFAVIMVFTYLMMTYVHANPNWFSGKFSFFVNLGWFFILLVIIAICFIGFAQITHIDLGAADDSYLDISPSFYFFILGFILIFFIIPKGSEALPNIYYQGWAAAAMTVFIILLMILSSAHDVCCLLSGDYEFEDGFVGTKISNLGFIIATVTLYILSNVMHPVPIYFLAILTPIGTGIYYYLTMEDNNDLSVIDLF